MSAFDGRRHETPAFFCLAGALLLLAGCGDDGRAAAEAGGTAGAGATAGAGTGASNGSGGVSGNGGTDGSAGSGATGGVGSGGIIGNGGTTAVGGTSGSGGTAGAAGTSGTGGTSSVGGTAGTSGTGGTGGAGGATGSCGTSTVTGGNLFCDELPIQLGTGRSNFHIDQVLYLGAGVQRFRFEVVFAHLTSVTPFWTAREWPAGVTLDVYDGNDVLVGSYSAADVAGAPRKPLYTDVVTGNRARFVVSSKGVSVDLGALMAQLVITQIDAASGPATATFADALRLYPGVETIAYSPGSAKGTHAFYTDLPPAASPRSLYVSPYDLATPAHDIGVAARWTVDPVRNQLPSSWSPEASPRPGDTGIYREMTVPASTTQRLFVEVDTNTAAFYRITVQTLRELTGSAADPLVVEMDGLLDGDTAPALTTDRVVAWAGAYQSQVDAFVQDRASYNRRVLEAMVIGSASLLAATEGYFRFNRIDFYHGFDSLRDVDISFGSDCGRANAEFHGPRGPIASINMFREATNSPFSGGITLLHEWGHYHWAIHDEYVEGYGTVDLNSAMGSQYRTIEFCGDLNHVSSTGGHTIGPDSAWHNIETAHGVVPPRPPTSPRHYPQNRSLYLDVLHELEAMQRVVEFPNPTPTGQPINGACKSIGESCTRNRECTFGQRCDVGPTTQNTSRCVPNDGTGLPGDFCSHNNQCRPGDYCRLESGQNYGACAERGPLGATCTGNVQCSSGACDTSAQRCVPINNTGVTGNFCTQDAHCASNDCVSNACRSFAPIGETCSNGRRCASGRRCDSGIGTQNTGRCIPDDGEGRPGQFCSHNNQCLPGDFCRLESGQNFGACAEPGLLGAACTSNVQCSSGACDTSAQRCVPINNTGVTADFCTQDAHCASNDCLSNACRSFAAIGETCSNGRRCASSRRCDSGIGTQNTGRCIPDDGEGRPGQFCSHNNQCLPGDFCRLESGQNYGVCAE